MSTPNDGLRDLHPDERAALERTARSRTESHGIVMRAHIVLDCADAGFAAAARRSGVSAATAAKWWKRFVDAGLDGLHDSPRSGRPSASPEDVAKVLDYSLRTPPDGAKRWSTRSIAQDSGLSQATVSRIRRRLFGQPERASQLLSDNATAVLSYVDVSAAGCALGVQRTHGTRATTGPAAALVDAIETISATALLRRPHDGYRPDDPDPRAVALLRRAAERLPPVPPVTLLIDVPLDVAARMWLAQHPEIVVRVLPGEEWLGMVHRLADAVDSRQLTELRTVQQKIWQARSDGRREFTWLRGTAPAAPGAEKSAGEIAADPVDGDLGVVVTAICAAISNGELRPGDDISARVIARRTGMSPGRVTEACSRLATEALLDRQSGRYLVPMPSPRDVIETYTARGLLGTAIARRLAAPEVTLPPAVDAYLDRLAVCDRMSLAHDAYMLDLDFQNELARAAAMPRIGWMFIQLSMQLRLFVTIVGLDYQYPTDEIVDDGRRVVAACRSGDPDAAVAEWRRKTDNSARHMLTYLDTMTRRQAEPPSRVSAVRPGPAAD